MFVATIQYVNYSGQESNKKKLKKINAVYDLDTPVTLKQCQGQQTWYELVDQQAKL